MQLYALNDQNQVVGAHQASKKLDYQCFECQSRVRLRGGFHRQNHFYHVDPNQPCRLSGKGMVHLQIQIYLKRLLNCQTCFLEYRFPSIGRVADVAWLEERLIFEIQCSPISAQEVLARNQAYASLGWQVVWILHDQRFNQKKLSAAEWVLRSHPFYFTNFNEEGIGLIYDQFDQIEKGIRSHQLEPLPVNLSHFKRVPLVNPLISPLQLVQQRLKEWSLTFEGDLIDVSTKEQQISYRQRAHQIEQLKEALKESLQQSRWQSLQAFMRQWIIRPYDLLFQMLLERMCK